MGRTWRELWDSMIRGQACAFNLAASMDDSQHNDKRLAREEKRSERRRREDSQAVAEESRTINWIWWRLLFSFRHPPGRLHRLRGATAPAAAYRRGSLSWLGFTKRCPFIVLFIWLMFLSWHRPASADLPQSLLRCFVHLLQPGRLNTFFFRKRRFLCLGQRLYKVEQEPAVLRRQFAAQRLLDTIPF